MSTSTFTVRALDNLGNAQTRTFSISIGPSQPIWNTPAGNIGAFASGSTIRFQLSAFPVPPATSLTYQLISGQLPPGVSITNIGLISGNTAPEIENTTYTFTIRVTDNNQNLRDRTFSIIMSGVDSPEFTTPSGTLLTTFDSIWVEYPIEYSVPIPDTSVIVNLVQGSLPPGLEINEFGLIRGYPEPPTINVSLGSVNVSVLATLSNTMVVSSTLGFRPGRPIVFSGDVIGGVTADQTYYVREIINETTFTISTTVNGPVYQLSNAAGFMIANLPNISVGQPTIQTYDFTLKLITAFGEALELYSIVVVNQNASPGIGGPGRPLNTRTPTILNTRPLTYNILENDIDYRFYLFPPITNTNARVVLNVTNTTATTNTVTVSQTLSSEGVTAGKSFIPSVTIGTNLIAGRTYYILAITGPSTFTVSATQSSSTPIPLTTGTTTSTLSVDISRVEGSTYNPTQLADIGRFNSDDKFAFQVLGKDFDNSEIEYVFAGLKLGLVGDSTTGWVTGNPIISPDNINQFTFSVAVRKRNNPGIITEFFNFSFVLRNSVDGEVVWVTPTDLGTVFNGTDSTLSVVATSDVPLEYSLVSGTLPPNLSLFSTGELAGTVAFQPNDFLVNANTITDFTFTVRAYSPNFSTVVTSDRTFTISVEQLFSHPLDNIYIKCTPGIADRDLLATLLDNDSLIPNDMVYRPNDINFGKATNVIYKHAFGINASSFNEYVAAVTKNHYWRQLTLGEIKTAVARDEETGEIIYEVVYSSVIDNLVNPQNVSVSKEIFWPRFIPLNQGPWYTSVTDIYTSYVGQNDQLDFYTSLTPGFARLLYPNSLDNMREQVEDVLGSVNNTNILPLWMTSQQIDGNTLGFTPAWVICYTKPAVPTEITVLMSSAIDNSLQVSTVDDLIVGGEITFPGDGIANLTSNALYYVASIDIANKKIQVSTTKYGSAMRIETSATPTTAIFDPVSYADYIKYQIENNWKNPVGQIQTLNLIDFKIDRFTVQKKNTYNYDNNLVPPAWTSLPSGSPVPDPADSKDFYVLFPRQTILPNQTQYPR
jgi:hypothetical protein